VPSRKALRVLLVDDDSLVRWALGRALIQHGCIVVEASDAESAIWSVTDPSNVFDVILLDDRLSDAHGLELLMTLKQLVPRTRVVMMSAGRPADLAEWVRGGAAAFVPKPFDLDDVWTLIRRVCSSCGSHTRRRGPNNRASDGDGRHV
jgi:two-component system NtrC family response regulator